MIIKILDKESKNLDRLEREVFEALTQINIVGTVEKHQNFDKFSKFNIKETPVLIVNNKVKFSGILPQQEEIRKCIEDELQG